MKTVTTIEKSNVFLLTEDDVFVIGGLVDRSVIKYASLNRA